MKKNSAACVSGNAETKQRRSQKKPAIPATVRFEEYSKYFVAPQATPEMFRVFDLTDGGSISFSSHT